MKNSLYYFAQNVLVLASLLWAYLPTEEMDFFPWGKHHQGGGGWYAIGILIFILPLMLICFLLRYWALRKMEGVVFYRLTPLLIFLGLTVIALFNLVIFHMSANAFTLLTGLAMAAFFVVEMVWFTQGKKPWRDITSW